MRCGDTWYPVQPWSTSHCTCGVDGTIHRVILVIESKSHVGGGNVSLCSPFTFRRPQRLARSWFGALLLPVSFLGAVPTLNFFLVYFGMCHDQELRALYAYK